MDRPVGIDKHMDVIGVHVIDPHVNAFAIGVFSEVTETGEPQLLYSAIFRGSKFPRSNGASNGSRNARTLGSDAKPLKRLVSIAAVKHRPKGRC